LGQGSERRAVTAGCRLRPGALTFSTVSRAAQPIEIVHLAHTHFPADTRVKREAYAAAATGRRVAVIALRGPGERSVERLGAVTVIRVPGGKARGGPISYLRAYADFTLRCRDLLAHHPRLAHARLVHVHTLPDVLVWAARPAQRRGARVILDLHEILPEFTRAKYPGLLGGVAAHAARAVERWARRRADVTITVNAPIEQLLAARPIGRPEQRVVIHNSADPDDFGPQRPPTARVSNRGPLELVYHGSLTPLYGLVVAVRGVAIAGERGCAVHLTLLGEGPHRPALEQLVGRLGLVANVRFESPLPQAALPARLSRCDAGVVPTRLDAMTRYSLSNKLLEYVHLGLPILAARLPSYRHYLAEDTAWYWTPGDPADFARTIEEFASAQPDERLARARRAQLALAGIAWPGERERLVTVYREMLAES
jgi:glycosyltransferase involved in cell wall biosynthesis